MSAAMTPPMDLRITVNQSRYGDVFHLPDIPSSEDWLLVSNPEVVDDGLEILSMLLRPVGGLDQRLTAASLTTDVVSNLSHRKSEIRSNYRTEKKRPRNNRFGDRGVDFTYHEEVGLHKRVHPLFIENERGARETGDEHDGRFGRVAGRLCPNLGTVRGSYIDGHSGRESKTGREVSLVSDCPLWTEEWRNERENAFTRNPLP